MAGILATLLIVLGMGLRVSWMQQSALWCDEAESSINALTILETGLPGWKYLGLPVYENTLTKLWEEHPEYEFRDSTYSDKGVVVYHGWLPLYAMAASQALFGLKPDYPVSPPRVQHGPEDIALRTFAPRFPSLLFSLACMILVYKLGSAMGGPAGGLAALALMALNAKTIDFGFQARYYSLTLLMNVTVAWFLLQTARRGRWRDFLGLGISSALLFHTHLFSIVAFAGLAAATSPLILRQPKWLIKSLLGAGLAALLVVPWLVLSGFLTTASAVPKAFLLFESNWDAFLYLFDRPLPLLLLLLLSGILAIAWLRPGLLPDWLATPMLEHRVLYALLLWWLAFAYLAFHLIVPAASFFYERLSLVLWTPFVLLLALVTSDLLRGQSYQRACLLALAIPVLFLGVRGRLPWTNESSVYSKPRAVAAVLNALSNETFAVGTKVYATPNEHLTYTYYSGVPVQSVAPVRAEFFTSYPHPVVYVEVQMDGFFPETEEVEAVLNELDWPITTSLVWFGISEVWNETARDDLQLRGLPVPSPPELPAPLQVLVESTKAKYREFRDTHLEDIRTQPVLRGVPAKNIKDVWMGFFYRFVNPEDRIGSNLNIMPRLKNSRVELLPEAGVVLYISPAPPPLLHREEKE